MTGIFIRRPVEEVFDFVMAIEQIPVAPPNVEGELDHRRATWVSGVGSR
jgi:hypothetical protein